MGNMLSQMMQVVYRLNGISLHGWTIQLFLLLFAHILSEGSCYRFLTLWSLLGGNLLDGCSDDIGIVLFILNLDPLVLSGWLRSAIFTMLFAMLRVTLFLLFWFFLLFSICLNKSLLLLLIFNWLFLDLLSICLLILLLSTGIFIICGGLIGLSRLALLFIVLLVLNEALFNF